MITAAVARPCRSSPAIAYAPLIVLVLLLAGTARAGWYGEEYTQCEGTTIAIVQCLARHTQSWDRRLNEAYQVLIRDSHRAHDLRQAQRLWIRYRDANCDYYRAGAGSISAIEAAECMRVMTKERVLELERLGGEGAF